jgi:DNA-binding MarR family transcriptional regulator
VTAELITEDLREFITGTFPSVPHLEALLLLRRAGEQVQTVAAMAERLYIDEPAAAAVLADLVAAGLIARDTKGAHVTFRYAPRTARQADLVDRLQALHSRALLAITNLIHGRSAQLFADAFRFRKE